MTAKNLLAESMRETGEKQIREGIANGRLVYVRHYLTENPANRTGLVAIVTFDVDPPRCGDQSAYLDWQLEADNG